MISFNRNSHDVFCFECTFLAGNRRRHLPSTTTSTHFIGPWPPGYTQVRTGTENARCHSQIRCLHPRAHTLDKLYDCTVRLSPFLKLPDERKRKKALCLWTDPTSKT
ncbi:hypothetical protein DPEC_G00294100 [Dallia pectoralis]|uniref:Uncharacterized protein n=1 Tax=Dallia pectoralis TaxID=75939 RepID=A0ACC2FID0_DALPE|nr:hypothetical protein DPEC_G00294100 [Dallia pectoralis]